MTEQEKKELLLWAARCCDLLDDDYDGKREADVENALADLAEAGYHGNNAFRRLVDAAREGEPYWDQIADIFREWAADIPYEPRPGLTLEQAEFQAAHRAYLRSVHALWEAARTLVDARQKAEDALGHAPILDHEPYFAQTMRSEFHAISEDM